MNGCIGTCGFSENIYVYAAVVSAYGNVQIIYRVVFLCGYFELEIFVYCVDLVQDCLFIRSVLVVYYENVIDIPLVIYYLFTVQPLFHVHFLYVLHGVTWGLCLRAGFSTISVFHVQ